MMMQCVVVPAGAKADDTEKYEILCALGFFSSDLVYKKEATVQKIELLDAIFSAIPKDKQTLCSDDTGFSDVKPTDDIANVAYNTYLRGLLGGDRRLNPYATIGIEEASKILVNLLGYGAMVSNKGYSAIASDLGLTKNMSRTSGFTAENMVCMLYNALDVEVVSPMLLDTSKGRSEEKTFMSEMLLAGSGSGIVNANAYTGISGKNKTADGEIMVGSELYKADNRIGEEYIGCKIDYYYKLHDGDDAELVYAKLGSNVKITEIDAENIISFKNLTYRYEYGPDLNKTKDISFTSGAAVIYNGLEIVAPFDKYMPSDGSVKLISNSGNSKNDVVIINDCEIIVAEGYNFDKGIIYDKYNPDNEIELDRFSKPASYEVRLSDGTTAKFTDINEYDILSVARSQNNEKITITVSKDSVSGTVNSLSSLSVKINGIVYQVAETNYLDKENVSVRASGIFHLDEKGRVTAFEKQKASGLKAGYLTKMSLLTGDEMELEYDVLKIKFFSEDGEIMSLYTGKNVYFNDTKVDNVSAIFSEFTTLNDSGNYEAVPQLFLYKSDTMGKIRYIYKARPYDDSSIENKDGFCEINSQKEWLVRNEDRQFQMTFRFTDDTVIIAVPKDVNREEGFSAYKGGNPFTWRQHAYFRAYAMETNASVADYIVWYRGESGESGGQAMAIDSMSYALDKDDNPVHKMTGIRSNGSVELTFASSLSGGAQDLESGDIISAVVDEDNVITDFTKLFDYGEQRQLIGTSPDKRADPRYGFWNVYSVDNNDLIITKKAANDTSIRRSDLERMFMTGKSVYKFNKKKKRFETVDIKDISGFDKTADYSKIFTITKYGDYSFSVFYD